MTSNEPWPQHDPPGGHRYGPAPVARAAPAPAGQSHVDGPGPARALPAAPANTFAPAAHTAMPARIAGNRTQCGGHRDSSGGGGFLAFPSLFLVLPFLVGNTGITGFVIGFIASLIPLAPCC